MTYRHWSEDKELHQKRCKILANAQLKILDEIDKKESNFWENLIDEYLRPIDKDKEKDKRIKKTTLGNITHIAVHWNAVPHYRDPRTDCVSCQYQKHFFKKGEETTNRSTGSSGEDERKLQKEQ